MLLKTIIELYDRRPIPNILAATVFRPDDLVFVGGPEVDDERFRASVTRYFETRGPAPRLSFRRADVSDCRSIFRTLRELFSRFPECAVEVNGGGELALIAVGMLSAEADIPVFSYDDGAGTFINVNNCPEAAGVRFNGGLSVRELIAAAGGRMSGNGRITPASVTRELTGDIGEVWKIFSDNKNEWSGQTAYFQALVKRGGGRGGLRCSAPLALSENGRTVARCDTRILRRLALCGVLRGLKFRNGRVSFEFKSQLLRDCLCDAGIWLELRVYLAARDAGFFDDTQISVVINWESGGEELEVTNEIDVIAVRGVSPLFVSCKKGIPSPLALSEIAALSARFGGGYSRAVIATMSDLAREAPYIARRAAELGIYVLDFPVLTGKNLTEALTGFFTRREGNK